MSRRLLWALPPVALLALLFLYPLALVVRQSFQPDSGGASLQPYADVFAAGCLVLGFLLSLVISFVPFPGAKGVARFIDVYLSFPSFLITLALLFIYGTTGIIGSFQFLTTPWGVLLAEVTYFTPFVMRPLLAAFSQLDTAQLEAAGSLGARAPRIVRRIVLPEAQPALAAGGSLGQLLVANGDVQMNYAQSKDMPGLGIWFPAVTKAPHSENGKKLLDFMLARKQRQEVSEIGGGFAARQDVKATDANAIALTRLMDGVEIFEPDWNDIDKNLASYVEDWKSATGS